MDSSASHNESQATREKLIQAAQKIVDREGFQGLTTRQVARESGLNAAAVNYHFGSKENITLALWIEYFNNLSEWLVDLGNMDKSPEEKLRYFFEMYINFAFENTQLYQGMAAEILLRKDFPGMVKKAIKEKAFDVLKGIMKEVRGDLDDEKLGLMVLQVISCVVVPLLAQQMMTEVAGCDLMNKKVRENYIELLMLSVISSK